ncbi:MAG TPA: hypothetical protein VMG60_09485 [Burkholderiaceae bacterium]|nr:hypothetical protein [Burkholderiaceae bacterium]
MKRERSNNPRGKTGAPSVRGAPRKFGDPARRGSSPPGRPLRDRGDVSDPYQPARRPGEFARDAGEHGPRERPRPPGPPSGRAGRGFTVTLDPDVARVFRGDASVNRALRLVLQLMQVVQGPPAARFERAPRGYQGTPEARGFKRRARFEDESRNEDDPE